MIEPLSRLSGRDSDKGRPSSDSTQAASYWNSVSPREGIRHSPACLPLIHTESARARDFRLIAYHSVLDERCVDGLFWVTSSRPSRLASSKSRSTASLPGFVSISDRRFRGPATDRHPGCASPLAGRNPTICIRQRGSQTTPAPPLQMYPAMRWQLSAGPACDCAPDWCPA